MGNGFKVWHHTGALLHETTWPTGQELYEVVWQKYSDGLFKEQPITNEKIQGIQPSQPQASKAVYVPPNARPGGAALAFSPRSAPELRGPIPGIPASYKTNQGQLKKARNAKKRNGIDSPSNGTTPAEANHNASPAKHSYNNGEPRTHQQQPTDGEPKRRPNNRTNRNNGPPAAFTTGDPEKDKRLKVVQKKLKEIFVLKQRKTNGENLEANQLSKINMETDLCQELTALKVKA